jgi:hypothetical protein
MLCSIVRPVRNTVVFPFNTRQVAVLNSMRSSIIYLMFTALRVHHRFELRLATVHPSPRW